MADTHVTVEAAGGVVWRGDPDAPEILLVHRPRYDDWTLPKGKLDPGETHEQAALREVEEETGLRCRLGDELAETRYVDHRGRDKRVRYWTMTVEGGSFTGEHEVDAIRWLPLPAARRFLTYERDVAVLDAFERGRAR